MSAWSSALLCYGLFTSEIYIFRDVRSRWLLHEPLIFSYKILFLPPEGNDVDCHGREGLWTQLDDCQWKVKWDQDTQLYLIYVEPGQTLRGRPLCCPNIASRFSLNKPSAETVFCLPFLIQNTVITNNVMRKFGAFGIIYDFFKPCIVVYMCNKNQKMHSFYVNNLIYRIFRYITRTPDFFDISFDV
jgi:hypothetical protein